MHARQQIRQAVAAAVQAGVAGLQAVSAHRTRLFALEDLPSANVTSMREGVDASTGLQQRTLEVVVELTAAGTDGAPADDALDGLAASVEALLAPGLTVAGAYVPLVLQRSTGDFDDATLQKPVGQLSMAFHATYFTNPAQPEVIVP